MGELKDVTDANQHFFELKQCQRKHRIRKSDCVNQPKLQVRNKQYLHALEFHCFPAMKIVRHHANACFDWLISEH